LQKQSRRCHFGDQPTFIQMSAIRPRATPAEYQKILPLRQASADGTVAIVEGV
jgi:uncharacterized protein (DUF1330 family)